MLQQTWQIEKRVKHSNFNSKMDTEHWSWQRCLGWNYIDNIKDSGQQLPQIYTFHNNENGFSFEQRKECKQLCKRSERSLMVHQERTCTKRTELCRSSHRETRQKPSRDSKHCWSINARATTHTPQKTAGSENAVWNSTLRKRNVLWPVRRKNIKSIKWLELQWKN